MNIIIRFWILVVFGVFACNNLPQKQQEAKTLANKQADDKTELCVILQPFEGIPQTYVDLVEKQLPNFLPCLKKNKSIALPHSAWYAPRQRYKADTLIDFLANKTPAGFVTLGLTHFDISTTKGNVADYGIMGLGFQPGKACVVSYFRLSKTNTKEQFLKLCLHELGHTQGLPHCPDKTCFMRDAEGKNKADEEKAFCASCKKVLILKGWKL
ncbi:MAG: Zn-dependent protease [Bacteroidia bacterium]|nr:Zn-dependent protease [Bacteroidia bacterium]